MQGCIMAKLSATNQSSREQLDDDEFAEFKDLIVEVYDCEDQLRDKEITFVDDLMRRFEMYGRKVIVSEAQLDWLRRIRERL
jgi:hypothetical protein